MRVILPNDDIYVHIKVKSGRLQRFTRASIVGNSETNSFNYNISGRSSGTWLRAHAITCNARTSGQDSYDYAGMMKVRQIRRYSENLILLVIQFSTDRQFI